MDQNSPARSAAVHTITRAPAKSMTSESAITAIQLKTGERRTVAPRFDPRHAAQCQIPSHCVAHSWQSIFAHDMQRANAGRCSCTEQRCVAGTMDRASLAEVSTGLDNARRDPYSHPHT